MWSASGDLKRTRLDDLKLIKVLGKGCTSKVLLVRHSVNGCLYALKSIHKAWIIENAQLEHLQAEQRILKAVSFEHQESPDPFDGEAFLIKLHACFQSRNEMFYLMDYHPGGDLAALLARQYRLAEPVIREYASEMALAVHALHIRGIVYRDFKPENILFDRSGHVVLTDFGLSKRLRRLSTGDTESTRTFCGTAEYLAPEILAGMPYGMAVDWWSYGTCLYEMAVGTVRFTLMF